jgi:hypothetical protein
MQVRRLPGRARSRSPGLHATTAGLVSGKNPGRTSFGRDPLPGEPPGRIGRMGDSAMSLSKYLTDRDREAVEDARRRRTRPAGTPQWMLDLGDDAYAAEVRRRA